ncbi:MAG: polysaccharide biosynthesis protein, partial [Lachnospiraceae bacterium]|nr:polysaccharide biosynthesis protein [Lachnospiraceae bacterium]
MSEQYINNTKNNCEPRRKAPRKKRIQNWMPRQRLFRHWKRIAAGLMVFDALAVAFSYFFGLWLRFDFRYTTIEEAYLLAYIHFIPFYIIASIIFFWFMRMYR